MSPQHSVIAVLLSCLLLGRPAVRSVLADKSGEVHAALSCRDCHESALVEQFNRAQQARGPLFVPGSPLAMEQLRLTEDQILELSRKCGECHDEAASAWQQSAHAMTYGEVFLHRDHNRVERLSQDCLRCHGMFFAGAIEDLVEPLNVEGPWKIKPAAWEQKPAIPCLACHQAHPNLDLNLDRQTGEVALKSRSNTNHLTGFYDRRERAFFTLQDLPRPKVQQSNQWLPVSIDPRLPLCYQCHAPRADHQAGTSDDKTPQGVHSGLSCLDCHGVHHLSARSSCQNCHPTQSHCGLDVRLMDTTFNAKASRHDIHTVSCEDCHQGKRPGAEASR